MYCMRNLTTSRLAKLRETRLWRWKFWAISLSVTLFVRMTVLHLQQLNIIDDAFKYYFKGAC